jgi:hypothetical protein
VKKREREYVCDSVFVRDESANTVLTDSARGVPDEEIKD